jgi:D-alanyl-D-alanine endopeptidase (penicillin-binding protein 7)
MCSLPPPLAIDDRGGVVYAKNPDEVRAIASTGKIFVAMAVRRRGIDLGAATEITPEDRDHARGGARTRLDVGQSFTNRDLLVAMLVASDNRAPTALGRAVGLTPNQLVGAMNTLADELGLEHTRFTDPTGMRGNVSTPREMAQAFQVAMTDPVIAEILAIQAASIRSVGRRPIVVDYMNTNVSLRTQRFEVLAGKTGYNDPGRYCLLIAARIAGRRITMVFLGAEGKLTRFGDFNRVATWLDGGDRGSAPLLAAPRAP